MLERRLGWLPRRCSATRQCRRWRCGVLLAVRVLACRAWPTALELRLGWLPRRCSACVVLGSGTPSHSAGTPRERFCNARSCISHLGPFAERGSPRTRRQWRSFSLGSGSERQGCVERSLGHLARLSQRGWPLALPNAKHAHNAARCLWAAARRHQDHCRAPWASFTAEHGHPAERLERRLAGVWGAIQDVQALGVVLSAVAN